MLGEKTKLITDFFSVAAPAPVGDPALHVEDSHFAKAEARRYNEEILQKAREGRIDATKKVGHYRLIATGGFTNFDVHVAIAMNNFTARRTFRPGAKIGEATVEGLMFNGKLSDAALTSISVDPTFRRKGIGTELIKFINNCCEKFLVFGGITENSRYRLTEEGSALIRACLRRKILDDEQYIPDYVPTSPGYGG